MADTRLDLAGLTYLWSKIKALLAGKQDTITGAASTIADDDLTPGMAIYSNSAGKIVASSIVTAKELGYLDGVTSNIQTQIDSFKPHTVTTAGTDLNDYTEQGQYYFSQNYTPSNIPAGVNGWVIVIPSGTGLVRQIWLRGGTANVNDHMMWVRSNYLNGVATSWGDWIKITTEKDLPEDSGWVSLTLADGVAASTSGVVATPRYRKIGNIVYVEGAVAFTAVTSTTTLFTLPSGYRPAGHHYILSPCSGTRAARLRYLTSGVVACEWIYNLNGTQYTGHMTWVDINCSFIAA